MIKMIKEMVSQLTRVHEQIVAFEPKEDFDRAVKTCLIENLEYTLKFAPNMDNRFPTYREEVFDASYSAKTLRQLFYSRLTDSNGSWTERDILLANKYNTLWQLVNDANYYYRELFKMIREGDEMYGITPEG